MCVATNPWIKNCSNLYRPRAWMYWWINDGGSVWRKPHISAIGRSNAAPVAGDYVGQEHLLGAGKPLREAIERGHLHSMILWGPPGVGKTTLARLFAEQTEARISLTPDSTAERVSNRAAVSVAGQERAGRGRKD